MARIVENGLPPDVMRLAESVRAPKVGPLDVALTAEELAVTIRLLPQLDAHGLAVRTDTILLERGMSPSRSRMVFAHEVGHLLIRRGRLRSVGDEEVFVDQFGDEMLLPAEDVRANRGLGLVAVADMFSIPVARVAAQFARSRLIPPLTRLLSGDVICARCGDRRSVTCDCLYYRVNQHKAGHLPLAS